MTDSADDDVFAEVVNSESTEAPPSTGEGGSWFDYWLPKDQRPDSMADSDEGDSESCVPPEETGPCEETTLPETIADESAASRDDSTKSDIEPYPETEPAVDAAEADDTVATAEPIENVPAQSVVPVIDPDALVLEIVDETPLAEEVPVENELESASSDEVAADESPVEQVQIVDLPTTAETQPPQETPAESDLVETAGSHPQEPPAPSKPVPVREPINAWRSARTDWFSADSSAGDSLIPTRQNRKYRQRCLHLRWRQILIQRRFRNL